MTTLSWKEKEVMLLATVERLRLENRRLEMLNTSMTLTIKRIPFVACHYCKHIHAGRNYCAYSVAPGMESLCQNLSKWEFDPDNYLVREGKE